MHMYVLFFKIAFVIVKLFVHSVVWLYVFRKFTNPKFVFFFLTLSVRLTVLRAVNDMLLHLLFVLLLFIYHFASGTFCVNVNVNLFWILCMALCFSSSQNSEVCRWYSDACCA